MLEQGRLRFDLLVMFSYQLLLFYSNQQLFPVLMEYMPKTMCIGSKCYKLPENRCIDDAKLICDDANGNTSDCIAKYAFKEFNSAAMELGYYCKVTPFFSATFVQFTGLLLGTCLLGYVADKVGRRGTLMGSLLVGIPSLVLSAFLPSPEAFYLLYFFRFLLGFTTGGTLVVGWAYHSELVSAQHRFKCRTFINWANGRMLVVLVSYYAQDWRLSSYICAGMYCLYLAILFFLPESPIWLRTKGFYQREEAAWKRIAWFCNAEYTFVTPPVTSSEELRPKTSIGLTDVLKHPVLRKYLLVMWVMWFCNGVLVYTMDLGSDKMSDDLFLAQFLSCVILSLGSITIGFLDHFLPWFGRRLAFLGPVSLFLSSVVALLVIELIGARGSSWYMIMYLMASVTIYLAWEPCYMAIAELMPTDVRATAGASCNVMNRIGNLISTQIEAFRSGHQSLVFGVLIIMGCFEVATAGKWLPETKNREVDVVFINEEVDKEEQKHSISRRMTNSFRVRPVKEDKKQVVSTDV